VISEHNWMGDRKGEKDVMRVDKLGNQPLKGDQTLLEGVSTREAYSQGNELDL